MSLSKYRLVMIRHGESIWNKENRFTGWTDVPLTPTGIAESQKAGSLLSKSQMKFDVAHCSVLKRAIQTLNTVLTEIDQEYIPVYKHWRLNERHYGALQGLNKSETASLHGEEKVKVWRRSFDIPPPELEESDERYPLHELKYKNTPLECLPKTECLKDTIARTLPYWYDNIAPDILSGKQVLVVAHGNSLRGLVKHLDNISDQEIIGLNIPTGVPLVYELTEKLKPVSSYYLGDPEELKKRMEAVASQGKSK